MSEKEITLEEGMKELKDIVDKMEDSDLPLEESFKLYEEGTKLLKTLNDKVDSVSAKVEKLNEDFTDSDSEALD